MPDNDIHRETNSSRPWMQDLVDKMSTACGIQLDPLGTLVEWLTGLCDGATALVAAGWRPPTEPAAYVVLRGDFVHEDMCLVDERVFRGDFELAADTADPVGGRVYELREVSTDA